jgi:hypothetical protein
MDLYLNNINQGNPTANKREVLRVCIQLYSYHDRRINETELSVGELYHEIYGNDGSLDFNSFNSDIEWLISNGLISMQNEVISINTDVARRLIDYVFRHKNDL